jgi:hypothetical protein
LAAGLAAGLSARGLTARGLAAHLAADLAAEMAAYGAGCLLILLLIGLAAPPTASFAAVLKAATVLGAALVAD